MNLLRPRRDIYELGKPPVSWRRRGPGLVIIPLVLSVAWTVFFAWFVVQSIDLPVLAQLLPHEIGGIVAGFIAPPAAFFALAAMFANNIRTRDTVARLEAQVTRLAMPQAEAEAGLIDLGEEMRGYASTLERTIDHARAQLDLASRGRNDRSRCAAIRRAERSENPRGREGRTATQHSDRHPRGVNSPPRCRPRCPPESGWTGSA